VLRGWSWLSPRGKSRSPRQAAKYTGQEPELARGLPAIPQRAALHARPTRGPARAPEAASGYVVAESRGLHPAPPPCTEAATRCRGHSLWGPQSQSVAPKGPLWGGEGRTGPAATGDLSKDG
jgi:hypothetical protein